MKVGYGRFAIGGALLAAFLAAMGHVRYLQALEEKRAVVVVNREVQPFQKLEQTSLKLVEMPVKAVPADAITRMEDATGRYARTLLLPGDMLRRPHLVAAGGSALAARLSDTGNPNVRAMALAVSTETGVANTLEPGDRVDVLVAVRLDRDSGTLSRIIARGVPVLYTAFPAKDSFGGGGDTSTVVLQVTPELAEEIAFAHTSGTIWLLTTPQGATSVPTAGVDQQTFLAKYRVLDPDQAAQAGAVPAAGGSDRGQGQSTQRRG